MTVDGHMWQMVVKFRANAGRLTSVCFEQLGPTWHRFVFSFIFATTSSFLSLNSFAVVLALVVVPLKFQSFTAIVSDTSHCLHSENHEH